MGVQFQSFFHSLKIGWGFHPVPSEIAVVADGSPSSKVPYSDGGLLAAELYMDLLLPSSVGMGGGRSRTGK